MWLAPFGQLKLIKGASPSDAPTTLTDQDLANIKIASREAVWEAVLEDGYTATELMRLMVAVLAGKITKNPDGTPAFWSLDGTKVRLSWATDGTGNRVKRLTMDLV
jgi:hypothetical protein